MQLTKNILFLSIIAITLSTCIEPFNTNIEGQNSAKYVVFGQLSDQEGYQTVAISMSSSVQAPKYTPVTNCDVKIIDNLGNEFNMAEFEKGNYRVWMEKKYLNPGTTYQINIKTESGIEIVSDSEQMPESLEVDSVYSIRKDIQTSDPKKPLQGVQFYVDIDGTNNNSKYYRWDIIETWEHHAAYPNTWFWNKSAIVKINPPDFSKFYCWTTQKVKNIFTLSTEDLIQNKYKMLKLHFVDNLTQRLTYCYSINLIQYTLTKSAYTYWDKLRINGENQGGLYNTQPMHVKGNLRSTTNPNLEILGFFTASPSRAKRIFVRDVQGLEKYYILCEPSIPEKSDLKKNKAQYLIFQNGGLMILEDACVECDIYGGTTIKPEFWPY